MTSPSAPWPRPGHAVPTVPRADRVQARGFVPSALDLVSGLPGQPVGAVSLAADAPASALPDPALLAVPALTRSGIPVGGRLSPLDVEHPEALAGGRESWGLPKARAPFTWPAGDQRQVMVRQDGRVVWTPHDGRPRR
jgi:acetoacetate decarboxylase